MYSTKFTKSLHKLADQEARNVQCSLDDFNLVPYLLIKIQDLMHENPESVPTEQLANYLKPLVFLRKDICQKIWEAGVFEVSSCVLANKVESKHKESIETDILKYLIMEKFSEVQNEHQ